MIERLFEYPAVELQPGEVPVEEKLRIFGLEAAHGGVGPLEATLGMLRRSYILRTGWISPQAKM